MCRPTCFKQSTQFTKCSYWVVYISNLITTNKQQLDLMITFFVTDSHRTKTLTDYIYMTIIFVNQIVFGHYLQFLYDDLTRTRSTYVNTVLKYVTHFCWSRYPSVGFLFDVKKIPTSAINEIFLSRQNCLKYHLPKTPAKLGWHQISEVKYLKNPVRYSIINVVLFWVILDPCVRS